MPLCAVHVSYHAPIIQFTVTQDEAGVAPEDFYVNEYDATGTRYAQVILHVAGPLILDTLVSAVGPTDTSLAPCQVTAMARAHTS